MRDDRRPLASISLDLDDLWTYLRVRGDAAWRDRPSYLAEFLPRVLDFLDARQLRITFFIVGADAARPENADLLREIVVRGHDVANHSHEHESWLHEYSESQLVDELCRAEEAIAAATGVRPTGFRGPGYSWSPALLRILVARGYAYDASTLPTFIGPLARWYYFRSAGLTAAQRATRRFLFGRFSDGFRPLRPHLMHLPGGERLLEIPVTTMPLLRAPFHPSYLLYLSRISEPLMHAYLGTALNLCALRRVEPSILLHPLDLLGADDVGSLAFFPGMDLSGERKRGLVGEILARITARFRPVTMGEHAQALAGRTLPVRVMRTER